MNQHIFIVILKHTGALEHYHSIKGGSLLANDKKSNIYSHVISIFDLLTPQ